jgi:hypothetical protein
VQMMHQNDKIIKKLNNQLKPVLTEHNKIMRMLYAFDRIKLLDDNGIMQYDPSLLEVHIDEKWFFLTEKGQRTYVTKDELAPVRRVKNKLHITKVMFMCAVARPRFNNDGNCTFDGKIGMWPIVKMEAAQRSSNNRPRGTLITKPVNVTYQVYISFIINKLLPAIKAKFPRQHNPFLHIGLQHDNAPSHFGMDDPYWKAAINQETFWKFHLKEQPANSPDTNVLDLGFFCSIQSLQWQQEPASDIDGLIANVNRAWELYSPRTLERVWLSHQAVLNEILENYGDNNYKLPHMNKDGMRNDNGNLPLSIGVTEDAEKVLEEMELFDVEFDEED